MQKRKMVGVCSNTLPTSEISEFFMKGVFNVMIDTIKMVTMIPFSTFQTIQFSSDIKTSYNKSTGEVFYKIINGSLDGTYNSSLCIRVRRR